MKHAILLLSLPILAAAALSAAEPVLVGHYKLDDKEGDVVVDSSPAKNNAKAFNKPTPTEGKAGGALKLDGKNQYIEVPTSNDLKQLQTGSYTIMAWFKAENAPPGSDDANDAQYGIVIRTGYHEGLSFTNEKHFCFTHWLKGDPDPAWNGVVGEDESEPGQWYHVVGIVDKDARVAKIYVNGEFKGSSQEWDNAAAGREFDTTWKIGTGSPQSDKWGWTAKATIDDVRFYASALNDEQIKAIYNGK